ncbi:MAG: DUF1614 domain-containing protein [Methanoregulaceae archaeon]
MSGIIRISSIKPLSLFVIVVLILVFIVLIPLLFLGLIGSAFSRLGFTWIEAIIVIILMLVGSFVNIPLWTFQRSFEQTVPNKSAVFDAFTGEQVSDQRFATTLSLNIGGAVIPFAISVYLLYNGQRMVGNSLFVLVLIALFAVTLITRFSTKVFPDSGIRVPFFVPGLSAIAIAMILGGGIGSVPAIIAFVSGTMGTLLGACTLNSSHIKNMKISQISIGGAGMFGAIFLSGLLAAFIT